ncbi:MAG: hypothetical protein EU531_06645 [Promethearchaeota archaeon]|nr:MAG: hypothetical protein EU531_06645 [Candidatus Lokiarchaeota archaeon]
MIFQTDYWSYARIFFEWVANSAGVMVFITGFIALTWLGYERKRRGSFTKRKVENKGGFDLNKFLKILSYAGVIVGILDIWAGTTGLIQDIPPSFRYRDLTAPEADHFTCIFLIVVGIAILFKPVNDLPLASILGLLAGTATAAVLALLIPDNVVEWIGDYLINPKLLLIIIFIIVTAIVAVTAKFYIGVLQAISKFLSWPPIALIIMVFSFVQGILLWGLGTSIFVNLL